MLYDDIDILTTNELLALPPSRWLMEGIIPEEGFIGLYGAPGSGKSFIALDWAMCISEGRPWLGRYKTKQSPVVYVAAEGGRGIQQRVRAWMSYYGYRELPAMYYLLSPLYVRTEGTVEKFLDELATLDIWPGLLVLDTLSRSFGGGEENASADMGHFVDRVTQLATGRRMAVLVVHHKNATGLRERGNTAFRGATDAMFACNAEKDKVTGHIIRVELVNDKQKDALETPTIYVTPVAEAKPSLVFELTEPPPAKQRKSGPPQPMRTIDMLTLIQSHAETGLTQVEIMHMCGLSKSTFFRRMKRLTNDGLVWRDSGRYYAMPDTEDLIGVEDD
jgi:hypothetical protein